MDGRRALLVLLMGGCASPLPERTFATIDLGTGSLEVRPEEIVGPAAFAPQRVRFYFRRDGRDQLIGQTVLHDDGSDPGELNVVATELAEGTWQVTLKGTEQADERWIVRVEPGDVTMRDAGPRPHLESARP